MVIFCLAPLANPAFAQLSLGAKHDNKQPIEITSDQLEVLQKDNKAIFSGHVVAVQGDVNLKAEKMVVYYKQSESAAKTGGEKNAIQKIDVDGGVFLSTPEETASGDNGIYDVEGQKIFLNTNVVLTREKNVLKGDKLVYDFATGKSTLNAGGATSTGGKQRVKAVFVPSDEKPKK